MDHWKKCHQFILISGSTPSNQCQPSPPAWLRSDAVKSAIENDLRQHKKSLAKQRDTMQVLVDSQNIQDGYRVRVFSDCCSILLGKCHLRIFNSKLYFDFLCRITQIDPFFSIRYISQETALTDAENKANKMLEEYKDFLTRSNLK